MYYLLCKDFPENKVGKDLFTGDLHGMYDLLMDELDNRNFNPEVDRVYGVGDLIDRGPDSVKAIQLLKEPWFNSTLGNHDFYFIESIHNDYFKKLMLANGGQWIEEFEEQPELIRQWAALMRIRMPLFSRVQTKYGNIGLGHATFSQQTCFKRKLADGLEKATIHELVSTREAFSQNKSIYYDNVDAVVLGHNNVESPTVVGKSCWIDTIALQKKLTILDAEQIMELVKNG